MFANVRGGAHKTLLIYLSHSHLAHCSTPELKPNGVLFSHLHTHPLKFPIVPLPPSPIPISTHHSFRFQTEAFDSRNQKKRPRTVCQGSNLGLLGLLLRGRVRVGGRPAVPSRAGRDGRGGQGGARVPAGAPTVRDHGGSQARHVRG